MYSGTIRSKSIERGGCPTRLLSEANALKIENVMLEVTIIVPVNKIKRNISFFK